MSRTGPSAAVLGSVAPRAELRGMPRADDRLKPARGILFGLGLCTVFWSVLAAFVLL